MTNQEFSLELQLAQAIATLKRSGIVAFPTDTVYGLGCNAFDTSAVERVFRAKGRKPDMALPLLLADAGDISGVALDVPSLAHELATAFWPGGLTLVLKKRPNVPDIVTGGQATVAVRVPDHNVPVALATAMGAPLIGTSANLSGQPSPTTAAEVERQLGSAVDYVMRGQCKRGVESTIVALTGAMPKILRQGAIARVDIERVCGKVE